MMPPPALHITVNQPPSQGLRCNNEGSEEVQKVKLKYAKWKYSSGTCNTEDEDKLTQKTLL